MTDYSSEDLVAALRLCGITYVTGGHETGRPVTAPLPLAMSLAEAPEARLRDALVALLLRHPEYAREVVDAAYKLASSNPLRRRALLSVLVAAALQQEWRFTLDIYLPGSESIDADGIAKYYGLPSPQEDFGCACLKAIADLQRRDSLFPFNYEEGWRDAARRLFDQLIREARKHESKTGNQTPS